MRAWLNGPSRPATVTSCLLPLLVLLVCGTHYVIAWKPISVSGGAAPAAGVSASFTTSFTVQQAHPAEKQAVPAASTSSFAFANSAEAAADGAEPKIALLKEDLQLHGVINSPHINAIGSPYHYVSGGGGGGSGVGDDYFTSSYVGGEPGVLQDNLYKVRGSGDSCAMKKFAFNADGVAKYANALPEFKQFTICFWMRFTNHSGDHVPLTYSVEKEPREIQFWVANSKNSSFISMAIKGQQMYRLNYPLRTRQWHHICSSWNGKTGEWQVWLKAERIGRGFHNSLVGYTIPGNGKLYSGGLSPTGEITPGLHFEVTLVQIYRIALSAGKAHRNHKHHHAHHFDHEGQELSTTTKPPPVINRPQTMHSLLANGQIPTRVRLNLAQPNQAAPPLDAITQMQLQPQSPQPQQQQQHQQAGDAITIPTNFVNGQIHVGSRLVAQQLAGHRPLQLPLRQQSIQTTKIHEFNRNPANVQYVDESETRIFFKRQAAAAAEKASKRVARHTEASEPAAVDSSLASKTRKQRGLVLLKDGSIVDDGLDGGEAAYKFDGLTDFAGQQFKDDLFRQYERSNESGAPSSGSSSSIDEQVAEHDREPAEEEVKAVMSLCSACDKEPFQGAVVFAWKDVHAELDNVLQGFTVGGCGDF